MYYISSLLGGTSKNIKYGVTDNKDDVEEFYTANDIFKIVDSGIKIRGVRNGSINIFTQNCDLKFSFREYIEDDGIIVVDILPNENLKKLAHCIYPDIDFDDSFGSEFQISRDIIVKFVSLESDVNGERFGKYVFYRDACSLNLYLPYKLSSIEYNRLREIVDKCLDLADINKRKKKREDMKLRLAGVPTQYSLEGYDFEGKLLSDGKFIYYASDKSMYCDRIKFEKSLRDDYKLMIEERELDIEATFMEYLETCITGSWIKHNVKLCM